jgi:hypothetical protein
MKFALPLVALLLIASSALADDPPAKPAEPATTPAPATPAPAATAPAAPAATAPAPTAPAAAAEKKTPSDDTIIKLCGDTIANMFAKCGTPDTITVNADKVAVLIYGNYGFTVNRDKVLGSYFFDDWKGTFKGVKYGDTKDAAVKALGKSYKEVKGKDNSFDAYGWPLTDQKCTFWLYFTDDKVSNVQITLDGK